MSVTAVHVDVTEPGRARVTFSQGYAYIGRQDGAYYATVDEWDGAEELPSREGFHSYKAAAKWVARTMGITGALDIQVKHEWKGQA